MLGLIPITALREISMSKHALGSPACHISPAIQLGTMKSRLGRRGR